MGKWVARVGVLLIILALSAGLTETAIPFMTWQTALAWSYVTAVVAGVFMGLAWLLRLISWAMPPIFDRLLFD